MPPPDVRAGLLRERTGSLKNDWLSWQVSKRTIRPFSLVVKSCADRDLPDHCPVSPKVPFAAVRTVSTRLRRREKDDAYPIVARLNERWRVITREVLLQRIAERCGEVDAAALDLVRALPDRYEEKRAGNAQV